MIIRALLVSLCLTAPCLAQSLTGAPLPNPALRPQPAPAAKPKVKPQRLGFFQPAAPNTLKTSSVLEIAGANPANKGTGRLVQMEAMGKKQVVKVADPVLTRADVVLAAADSAPVKVTSGPKPETREVPVLRLVFRPRQAGKLRDLANDTQHSFVALVVDGRIVSMPRIPVKIAGNEWLIFGAFTEDEVGALAKKINSGK